MLHAGHMISWGHALTMSNCQAACCAHDQLSRCIDHMQFSRCMLCTCSAAGEGTSAGGKDRGAQQGDSAAGTHWLQQHCTSHGAAKACRGQGGNEGVPSQQQQHACSSLCSENPPSRYLLARCWQFLFHLNHTLSSDLQNKQKPL